MTNPSLCSKPWSNGSARRRFAAVKSAAGKGFTIDVTSACIIDLGAEFGIDAAADGDAKTANLARSFFSAAVDSPWNRSTR